MGKAIDRLTSLRVGTALAVAVLLLAFAPRATAHEGNPDYRSVIRRVTPSVPGVTFQVIEYDADIQLLDQQGHEVTIYGYEGEPYARVLRDQTVQVNHRSPAFYMNENSFGDMEVPPIADAKAPPRWQTINRSGTFTWHDHRIHYMSSAIPPQVTDKGQKTKILDFRIPLRIDARRGAIEGSLFWVGDPDVSKLPVALVGAAILLGGGAAVLLLRRRRDESGPGAAGP